MLPTTILVNAARSSDTAPVAVPTLAVLYPADITTTASALARPAAVTLHRAAESDSHDTAPPTPDPPTATRPDRSPDASPRPVTANTVTDTLDENGWLLRHTLLAAAAFVLSAFVRVSTAPEPRVTTDTVHRKVAPLDGDARIDSDEPEVQIVAAAL